MSMKMIDSKLSAAAARKRKQRQRKSPEELREEQLSNTTSRSIARENPEVRRQEQLRDTAARSIAREDPEGRRREHLCQERNRKKWFPLGCLVDEITGEYKFDQPCGAWNKPCVYGCGYIHLSSASPGTLSRCCAGGSLSPISIKTDMDLLVNFELDEMPDYLMNCIAKSSTFAQDSSTYNNILAMAATKVCNYLSTPGWTPCHFNRRLRTPSSSSDVTIA